MSVTNRPADRYIVVERAFDARVVAGLRQRDRAAFNRAFDAYHVAVHRFLARLTGRRALAEDLVQETFLRLATHGDRLSEDTRLLPWLFTVARNLWVSWVRTSSLDADRLEALAFAGAPPCGPSPFEDAAGSELGRRLERALASLPDEHREVILLVAVERLDPAEAATVVGVSPEALRKRLSRARAMLNEALARDERTERRMKGAP